MASLALGVSKMMTGMFFTVVDGCEPQKIALSIAKSETSDLSSLIFGPVTQGLQVTEDFTNAPCLANYNNVVYLFYPNGSSLMYATYSGTGWSTSASTVPNANPAAGASAAAFNGLLYVFYQGGGGSSASPGLWYNAFNGSSWSNPIQVSGITMANSSSTCSPTVTINVPLTNIPVPAQYASAPSAVVFNTQLYVFYQNGNPDGQLWFTVFNGSSWIENKQVSSADVSCSPAAAVYDNDIYVFYQGGGKNGQLWYALFNGSSWTSNQVSASAGISSSPMAGVYNDNLVVAHQGSGNSTDVYYIYYNGSSWSSDTQLMPISLACSPGPVVFNGELYVFMQDKNSAGQLWYTGSDGGSWSLMTQVSGASMSISPGMVVFNDQLYSFYQGPGVNGEMNYSICTTDWTWSSPAPLNTIEISGPPTGVYFNDTLFCLYPDDGLLFCSLYDSAKSAWSPPFPLPNVYPLGAACAATYTPSGATMPQFYIFYQSGASGQVGELWYVTYDPSSGAVSTPTQVSGVNMMGNPSAAIFMPSGSTSPQLYVFYQSSGVCNYSVFNGTSWMPGTTGVDLSNSPSAALFNDQIYVFYQGATNDELYYTQTSSGSSWSSAAQVPSTALAGSPSATVFNGSLYVLHLSSGGTELYHNVLTGSSWSGDTQVSSVDMSNSPGGVATSNELYVFYEGPNDNEQLWYSALSTAAGDWSSSAQLTTSALMTNPAASSYNNVVYCFYEINGQLYSLNSGGTKPWGTQTLVPGVSLTSAPSAALFNNQVYIFYQGSSGGQLWYVIYNPATATYSAPAQVAGVSMTGNPSAVVFTPSGSTSSQLYVFYQSVTGGGLWYITYGSSSTWSSPAQVSGVTLNSGNAGASSVIGGSNPSAAVFNGQIYVFYQGPENSNGNLWYCTYRTAWSQPIQKDQTGMSDSPSAIVFNDQLYVCHQGGGNGGELWYSMLNSNGSWESDTRISIAGMSGSPCAAMANNQLYVFYEGPSNNGQLWYTVAGVTTGSWSPNTFLQPQSSSTGPAAVSYNNVMYCFYESNGQLCYSVNPGGTNFWNTQMLVPGVTLSGAPSAVLFNNLFYIFYQSATGGDLWYVTYDSSTSTWSSPAQVPGVTLNSNPSPAVLDNQLYVFYQGVENSDGNLWYCTYGTAWSQPIQKGQVGMSAAPSAVVFNDALYVFHQGGNSCGELWYSLLNSGGSWQSDTQVSIAGMSGSPSATALINGICVAYQGPGSNGQLWYNTFNGSSWSGEAQVSGVSMTGSPAAAALNNYSLWIIYGNSNGQLSYTVCSGQNNWDAQLSPNLPNWGYSQLNSVIPAPVVFNNQLYVFFQGGHSNGEMWYINSSNGSSWSGGTATNVAYTGMSGSPSPVVFNDKLYVFHMGSDCEGQLYCNVMSSDGSWGGDTYLNATSEGVWMPMWSGNSYITCASPSAVVFNGQIYCFFNQGETANNGYLTYVTLNGSESLTGGTINLTINSVIPNPYSPSFVYMSPAAVVYNNQIYVFWQAEGSSENTGTTQLFYTVFSNGSSWSNITQAGFAGAAAGSNVLAVLANQTEAIVAPFVDNYLVPDNLLNTAVLKEKEGGGVEWVKPTWTLATSP